MENSRRRTPLIAVGIAFGYCGYADEKETMRKKL